MKTQTGLDELVRNEMEILQKKKIGILCHQASVNCRYRHILELLQPFHKDKFLTIRTIFGPQHGLWGHTQDNMIEWEGDMDPVTGTRIFSLYGNHRKPTTRMLQDIDLVLIDLMDVGARYYTFIWTMALMLETCSEMDIECIILDRPNPIDGISLEGSVLDPAYRSFVGMYPLPIRHGMTIGEIGMYLRHEFFPNGRLRIIPLKHWNRHQQYDSTGLPWLMPSPNMPHPDTALVYPGMCLLEGTNISEGRGTTRPFEVFGTPWIDGWKLCDRLNKVKLPGVYFRPVQFLPTFQKYQDEICEGAFIHVLDKKNFRPVTTALTVLWDIRRTYPGNFAWKNPPYEYEYEKLPIDILLGNSWAREMLEQDRSPDEIVNRMQTEIGEFKPRRQKYLIY
jgi:uncharacterized protein YbbC (DUF1343 family)